MFTAKDRKRYKFRPQLLQLTLNEALRLKESGFGLH